MKYESAIKIFEINEAKLNNEKISLIDELNKQEYNHSHIIAELNKEINKLKNENDNKINDIKST